VPPSALRGNSLLLRLCIRFFCVLRRATSCACLAARAVRRCGARLKVCLGGNGSSRRPSPTFRVSAVVGCKKVVNPAGIIPDVENVSPERPKNVHSLWIILWKTYLRWTA